MTFEEIENSIKLTADSVTTIKQHLIAFFSALSDPFFVIDIKGNYIEALGGHDRNLYNDSSLLKDKNIQDIFSKDICELFMSNIKEVISTGNMSIIEYEISSEKLLMENSIESGWFEGRISPIVGENGEISAVLWLAINITKKKNLELQLRELTERDPLTGAYNRRFIQNSIQNEFSYYKRHKTPFSILFIDIDFFKSINDNYGHDIGDEAIKFLVELVSSQLRVNDIFARFGGEEFVLLLPHICQDNAFILAEHLRLMVKNSQLNLQNEKVTFTISIGLCQIQNSDKDAQSLLKRADLALYESKNSGRNRTTIA